MARGRGPGGAERPGGEQANVDGSLVGLTDFEASVVRVLEATEPGDVLAYGEVAAEAGHPGAARAVGNLLRRLGHELPWWRVVTASGRLIPHDPEEQARRLAAEGITTSAGRVIGPS